MAIGLLLLVPVCAGLLLEYGTCRFPKHRFWRYLPAILTVLAALLLAWLRCRAWNKSGGGAPWETLVFFPGIPAAGLLLGEFAGWRLWKWLWTPRVRDTKK